MRVYFSWLYRPPKGRVCFEHELSLQHGVSQLKTINTTTTVCFAVWPNVVRLEKAFNVSQLAKLK